MFVIDGAVVALTSTKTKFQQFNFNTKLLFEFGWELFRLSPIAFLKSFTLMPYILFDRFFIKEQERMDKLATQLFATVKKQPLTEEVVSQIRDQPMKYSLLVAHKVTLILWFAPQMRLALTYKIQKSLSRYWCWKFDIDPKRAALSF